MFGASSMIPTVQALAFFLEIGPLVAGLLLAGRVGSGIGAVLANMRPTEQCLEGYVPRLPAAQPRIVGECTGDSPSAAHPATILAVTRERWAQIGIMLQFLIVVRTLGEIFRLRHILGTSFSVAVAMPYVGGALIAACSCWVGVTLYFFRRYTLTAWIAIATVLVLLVYKISVIGR